MDLEDKNIIIVGATGGIGSVLSEKLSTAGSKLILIGRDRTSVEKLLAGDHEFYEVDLTNKTDVQDFLQKISGRQIDILINAAGIGIYKPFTESTYADWENSFIVNVTAPFLFIKGLLPNLEKSPDSLVLSIGSGAGVIPMRGRSIYCATKFALRGFILSLAEEYVGKSPKFCLITLGSTLTNFSGVPVAKKLDEYKKGRAYFTPEWVANKLIEIIKYDKRQVEYTLYPGDFGFGTWKKP